MIVPVPLVVYVPPEAIIPAAPLPAAEAFPVTVIVPAFSTSPVYLGVITEAVEPIGDFPSVKKLQIMVLYQ